MAKQSPEQKKTVSRVMHEFSHGELESSRGGKVKNRRQAVAIALSEAGGSNQQSPEENRQRYTRTKSKERRGETAQQQKEGRRARDRKPRRAADGREPTRSQLYEEAKRRDVHGRSHMSKTELQHAVHGG